MKFPDFVHSQKARSHTNFVEPDNAWDILSFSAEGTHQLTWMFGDRGIPATFRSPRQALSVDRVAAASIKP